MAHPKRARRRQRGSVEELRSGAFRVRVYAGIDPVSGRKHYLKETVPAGPKAAAEADKVMRRLANQVDEHRQPRTSATVDQLLARHLELVDVAPTTKATYTKYVEKHVRKQLGRIKAGAVGAEHLESLYAELRRCQIHCEPGRRGIDHRTPRPHACDERCRLHTCVPLAPSTVQQIHFLLNGAFDRAVRWKWISVNPAQLVSAPPRLPPDPQPPSAEEAARLLEEAWADPDWGALVWFAMTTGLRRGELCGVRWSHVDLKSGTVSIWRAIARYDGVLVEKDTKTHRRRRITLDPETVAVLVEHRERAVERAASLATTLRPDAFVFSLAPDSSTPMKPATVGQRYSRMAARLNIDTHLHSLRHYSATELIAAGVDIRTVAGRLGHGSGGMTTLRVYAAWVAEADQRAAKGLVSRLPERPKVRTQEERVVASPKTPREVLAVRLRETIALGAVGVGDHLPGIKVLAAEHGVAFSTVHRAFELLREWRLIGGPAGERPVVLRVPEGAEPIVPPESELAAEASHEISAAKFELRHLGQVIRRFRMNVDHGDNVVLDKVLRTAVRRSGRDEPLEEFELAILQPGTEEQLFAVLE